MPVEKKKFISVYVDVGECTDAIQHKDRGDFQVTGITLVYLFVNFSFYLSLACLHLTHP